MATIPAPSSNSSNISTLSQYAGPYVTNMLGKTQAYADTPYQVYQGPMTAGESGLQSKVFQGLGSLNFPSNLGQSFSSSGAYQPPPMNMGAYQQRPIGTGPQPGMTFNQGSNGFGDFGGQPATAVATQSMIDAQNARNAALPQNDFDLVYGVPPPQTSEEIERINNLRKQNLSLDEMMRMQGVPGFGSMQATTGLQNQGPAQSGGTYEDYLKSQSMLHVLPQTREQFEANKNFTQKTRDQGMDMLGRGNMGEIMAGLGGPGQMPQGGLAGLAGMMPPQPQQPQGVAQQYMNPYLQSVLQPQMEELRRQNAITNMKANAGLTSAGAFGGGRQAIMNAENNRNLMQEMNKTVGTGYANAYDKAQQQFNIEQSQAKTLAELMAQQGGTQRDINQQGITADYNEFLAQRDYPQKMLQFQQSMLQGLPIATTTNQAAPMSGIGQLSSTVGGMGNILESLKKFNLFPG
jgi:hypothetical protein